MPFYSDLLKQLSNYEVSPNLIWIAGISFLVAFVFLMREFFAWMVKQNELRQELRELQSEIENLNELLKESLRNTQNKSQAPEPVFPLKLSSDRELTLEN